MSLIKIYDHIKDKFGDWNRRQYESTNIKNNRHFVMTTVFVFVAVLTWNGTIQALIIEFIQTKSTTIGLVVYAVVVTIITIVITLTIGRSLGIELDDD